MNKKAHMCQKKIDAYATSPDKNGNSRFEYNKMLNHPSYLGPYRDSRRSPIENLTHMELYAPRRSSRENDTYVSISQKTDREQIFIYYDCFFFIKKI